MSMRYVLGADTFNGYLTLQEHIFLNYFGSCCMDQINVSSNNAQCPSQRSRSCLALALVALPVVNRDAFALHRHCRYPTNLLVKESFIAQQYPLESLSFSSALLSSTRSLQPRRVALREERVVLWSSAAFT